ncbi:MAG: phage holin family protein [Propionicimonas sp.]
MADLSGVADVIKNIQDDVRIIVKGELELAKAELLPQAKTAGISAGLFGGAGYFALMGATLLFCGLSFWLSLGFQVWFALDLLAALAWGFGVMAVLLFLVAGVLALIGKQRLVFTGAQDTTASAQASVDAVAGALARGKSRVASTSILGTPSAPKELE